MEMAGAVKLTVRGNVFVSVSATGNGGDLEERVITSDGTGGRSENSHTDITGETHLRPVQDNGTGGNSDGLNGWRFGSNLKDQVG